MSQATVPHWIQETARAQPDRTAFRIQQNGSWQSVTYGSLMGQMETFGLALIRLGIGLGERIVLLSSHRPELVACDLAVMSIGAVSVPIFPQLDPDNIRHLILDSGARLAVVESREHLDLILAIQEEHEVHFTVVYLGSGENLPEDAAVVGWKRLLERGKQASDSDWMIFQRRTQELKPEDLATFVYTSWTQPVPRAAVLNHRNMLAGVKASLEALPIEPEDLFLSTLNPAHLFERVVGLLAPLTRGATVAIGSGAEAAQTEMCQVQPSVMVAHPRLFELIHQRHIDRLRDRGSRRRALWTWAVEAGRARLLTLRERRMGAWARLRYALADRLVLRRIRRMMGGRLRFSLCGGGPLPPRVGEFFANVGVPILEGYELTEHTSLVAVNRLDHQRHGTVGGVVEGAQIRVAGDGEIMVRGPAVFLGYWSRDGEKVDPTGTVTPEGWLLTGDVGEISRDGYLTITGCMKDMIPTPLGSTVAARPVENVLRSHRMVSQAAMIGDSQHFLAVVLVPDFPVLKRWAKDRGIQFADRAELVRDIRVLDRYNRLVTELTRRFPLHTRPKRFTLLTRSFGVESGELTPTYKIRRSLLVQNFLAEIEELYS